MAEIVLAMIRPQDYKAFLELQDNDFPDSHDKWLYAYEKKTRGHRATGWTIISIDIYPVYFEQYCKQTESPPTQMNLDGCAYEKHKREKESGKHTE